MRLPEFVVVATIILISTSAFPAALDKHAVDEFIQHMVETHQFNAGELHDVFKQAKRSQRVLDAISRPAEALPWYKYRQLFVRQDRIENGRAFLGRYGGLLQKAESEYGVPAQIITAIIGVETSYGANKGNDRVIDALSTLAFHYPQRGDFFRGELEQYLLLTREQNVEPLSLKGSYAGAMGMPQFIPSSYRHYAIDFDGDGKTDIWNNPADAIGSVANYFKQHGWQPGGKVAVPGQAINSQYKKLVTNDLEPSVNVEQLYENGILPGEEIAPGTRVKIISLEGADSEEIWLGLDNFYVITRYNHSKLYAMAVYQLSEKILQQQQRNELAAGQ